MKMNTANMRGAPSRATVQTWARLVRASQTIINGVESEVQGAGFPPLDWYDILLELDRAGSGGLRPLQLQEKVGVAQYNLSRLMDRMAKAGMVDKGPCPDDRRGHVLSITETGRAILRKMWPVYSAAIQRHLGVKLSEGDLQMLALLLGRLTEQR